LVPSQSDLPGRSPTEKEISMKEWNVHVEGVGYIGTVQEEDEELARCAALYKFSEEGGRPNKGVEFYEVGEDTYLKSMRIYENDEFSVRAK